MSVTDSHGTDQREGRSGAERRSLSEFDRYVREDLPALREELAEVIENLGRISRGEPRIRRGARRASR